MKKTNFMKWIVLAMVSLMSVCMHAEGVNLYSFTWAEDMEDWVAVNPGGDKTWKFNSAKLEVQNESDPATVSVDSLVSPELDLSVAGEYEIAIERCYRDNLNDETVSIIYTTEDVGAATVWHTVVDNIVTSELIKNEWKVDTFSIAGTLSSTVKIAFVYTSGGSAKNRVRMKNCEIISTVAVDGPAIETLPYRSVWSTEAGWTIIDSLYLSKTWEYSDSYVKITDSKKLNNDWLISPRIDTSNKKSLDVSVDLGWTAAKSSNVSLFYATDYDHADSSATWQLVSEDIIPEDHGYGTGSSLRLDTTFSIAVDVPVVSFALQYAPYLEAGGTQNQIRVYDFSVEGIDDIPTALSPQKYIVLSVYPNPTTDILHISEKAAAVSIYTLSGKLVTSLVTENGVVDTSSLKSGMYLLVVSAESDTLTQKFVKQ